MTDPLPLIQLRNVTYGYDADPVLQDVSLQVHQGDCLALVGPNGGGKTTLLKLMIGLLCCDTGTVERRISASQIGYVPQQFTVNAGFPITVRDVIAMGGLRPGVWQSRPRAADRTRVDDLLQVMGITDIADRRMDRLSGGQRQRVLIARALFSDPELLVFDEPTSNIDPEGRYCFHELLAQISRRKTIIVVSHDFSILSSGVTCLAAVNQRVICRPDAHLSPDIMALAYGQHAPDCPMGNYLQDLAHMYDDRERALHA